MIVLRAGVLVAAMFLLVSRVFAQAGETLPAANQPALTVKPLQAWSGMFGGEKLELAFQVSGRNVFKGSAGWSVAVADRIIARGEVAVAVEPDKPVTVRPDFRLPPVKEGVVIQGRVSVSVYGAGGKPPGASCEKDIWIFSADPFAGRQQWLKGLQIQLFDPEKKTAQVFDNAKIPYTAVRNLDALGEMNGGLIVIGEGVSLADYRALSEMMNKAAANGCQVLCLALAKVMPPPRNSDRGGVDPEGGIAFPNERRGGDQKAAVASVLLKSSGVIAELDKRLDTDAWPPDGHVVRSTLSVGATLGGWVGAAPRGANGWPWFEIRYRKAGAPGGRFLFCGFAIVEKWNSGPAPRFLLLKLFEYMKGA